MNKQNTLLCQNRLNNNNNNSNNKIVPDFEVDVPVVKMFS